MLLQCPYCLKQARGLIIERYTCPSCKKISRLTHRSPRRSFLVIFGCGIVPVTVVLLLSSSIVGGLGARILSMAAALGTSLILNAYMGELTKYESQ